MLAAFYSDREPDLSLKRGAWQTWDRLVSQTEVVPEAKAVSLGT